jgi:hypothetical protein
MLRTTRWRRLCLETRHPRRVSMKYADQAVTGRGLRRFQNADILHEKTEGTENRETLKRRYLETSERSDSHPRYLWNPW